MYFHGSNTGLPLHTALYPNAGGYTQAPEVAELEALFEMVRPNHIQISRTDCVYLCDNVEDIDNVGGFTDYIYEADIADGFVEKSDVSWYTKAASQFDEGDIEGAEESARNYWSGACLEGVYEYRTDEAIITSMNLE
jgi:hypothetical protein